jgi:hypothetical protein
MEHSIQIIDTNNLSDCIAANTTGSASTVFFPDVKTDAWYAPQVCFAKIKGLINGYPDGTYQPNSSINFVEAAKILSHTFSLKVDQASATGEFWYRPYVQRLSDAIPAGITRFDQTLTRGQMAEMTYRLKADDETKASANISAIR